MSDEKFYCKRDGAKCRTFCGQDKCAANPHPLTKYDGYINTPSGKISIEHPDPKDINYLDICCGLANNCHFGGLVHPDKYFSIASHSLLVAQLANDDGIQDPEILLVCLLHDASEAYLGDMKKPMKVLDGFEKYRQMEHEMNLAVFDAFNLRIDFLPVIKKYDQLAQQMEYETFYHIKNTITQFDAPLDAYHHFLNCFLYLKHCRTNKYPASFSNPLIKYQKGGSNG